MTRKDYIAIANVIKGEKAVMGGTQENRDLCNSTLFCLAQSMADMLQSDNPRFDRERFIKACEVESTC